MNSLHELTEYVRTRRVARALALRNADLVGADLAGLRGDGLDFSGARLDGANLQGARLSGCNFVNASLRNAMLSAATLRDCNFDGANLVGAHLSSTSLEDSTAMGADLSNANLAAASLTESLFTRAVIRNAMLKDARGAGTVFRGADLSGATLVGARLDQADFRGADFRGADLTDGRFLGADFRGAILDGVRIEPTLCKGAHFDEGAGPDAGRASKASASVDPQAQTEPPKVFGPLSGIFGAAGIPGTKGDIHAHTIDQLQRLLDDLGEAGDEPPEEWKRCLEPLMQVTRGEQRIELAAVLSALRERPADLQDMLGATGSPDLELLDQLQQLAKALDAASNQPSAEQKAWLEPLLRMAKGEQPLDLQAVVDALSSGTRPKGDGTR